MIMDNIKQLAAENGYELTEYAEKIAKAKERFFGEEEWQRCPCDPNSDRACISDRCKEEIARDGHCHCNCYKAKENCNHISQEGKKVGEK
jgi:hypothetical protein